MDDCPFCLELGKPYGEILVQTEYAYLLTNPDPVLTASHMLIPKRHVETPFDFSDKEWLALKALLDKSKVLLDAQGAEGYSIGWNVCAVAGQHVAHAHLHVIGRFSDVPLAGKGIRHYFKQPPDARPER